jgi:hypothetical protein
MKFRLGRLDLGVALASLRALCACGPDPKAGASAGVGTIALEVTDAPFAHDIVEVADVRVREVRIRGESGFQTLMSGPALQLDLAPTLTVDDGVASSLLLDFDLTKTFRCVPATAPLAATSYQLHPVIHVTSVSETGGLRGVVREDDGERRERRLGDARRGAGDLRRARRARSTRSPLRRAHGFRRQCHDRELRLALSAGVEALARHDTHGARRGAGAS